MKRSSEFHGVEPMLVVTEPTGELLLIRQTDHATTCGQLARAWRRPEVVPRRLWSVLLEAVERHDDGWTETEQQPLLDDAGSPLDFKVMPVEQHVAIWRRSLAAAQHDDPYAALLVALHARLLYTTVAPPDTDDAPCAQTLIDELTGTINDSIERLGAGDAGQRRVVEPGNLQAAQRLFSFFDRLPLALPGGIPWTAQTEPLAFDDREDELHLRRDGQAVFVEPWPFEPDHVTLTTPAVRTARKRFSSSADLAQHLAQATPTELSWALKPA